MPRKTKSTSTNTHFTSLHCPIIGAIPVAGPTAATVLKYGLEQLYREGRLVALGSSLAESTYAGIAFWGFTTFMAQMQWIFPIAKLVGGFVLVLLGGMFMRYEHSSNTAMKTGKGAEVRVYILTMWHQNLLT